MDWESIAVKPSPLMAILLLGDLNGSVLLRNRGVEILCGDLLAVAAAVKKGGDMKRFMGSPFRVWLICVF